MAIEHDKLIYTLARDVTSEPPDEEVETVPGNIDRPRQDPNKGTVESSVAVTVYYNVCPMWVHYALYSTVHFI